MQAPPKTTRVILLRHGQSTYNAQGLFQGCNDDAGLTDKGRWMASRTGLALRHFAIDILYTSPLQRTQETAALILKALRTAEKPLPSLLVHPCLREISLHSWEGLPFKTVRQDYAADYLSWRVSPHTFSMTSRESSAPTHGPTSSPQIYFPVQDLYCQARLFWQEILPLSSGKTILIVSHGGTIRALIGSALHSSQSSSSKTIPPEAYFHALQKSNGGISMLTFTDKVDQPVRLEVINLTQHLGETLPKLKEGKTGLRLLLIPIPSNRRSHLAHLSGFLNQAPVDFCLYDKNPQIAVAAFQDLLSRQELSSHCLATGVAIADPKEIQSFINPILGLSSDTPVLASHLGGCSVVHYPATSMNPVIQAFNCSKKPFHFLSSILRHNT